MFLAGRQFYKCASSSCPFFLWADEAGGENNNSHKNRFVNSVRFITLKEILEDNFRLLFHISPWPSDELPVSGMCVCGRGRGYCFRQIVTVSFMHV